MNDTTHDQQTPDAEAAGSMPEDDAAADVGQLDALRQERDDARDRILRLTAEFDNYRKRMERERRELGEHLAAELLAEFLPVLDDLDRALIAASDGDDPAMASHRQGLELIQRQFVELLRRRQVTPIDALGADFDPHLHQAVGHGVSDIHREGEVLEELRRGYALGERLLRPSMVKVATRG